MDFFSLDVVLTRPYLWGMKKQTSVAVIGGAQQQPQLDDNFVLNPTQAAAFLGVSLRAFQRKSALGEVPKIQLSPRRVGYRLGDLRAYQRASVVKAHAS